MSREVHVRICGGLGLRCPGLPGVVVSEWEKAHLMCQVGIRKTMAVDVSKRTRMTSKPGFHFGLGKSLAGARLLARRCPAWRPRESGLLLSRGT